MKTILSLLLLAMALLAFPATPAAAAPDCEVDAFQGDCSVTAGCSFRHAYNSWIDWSHTTVDCSRYGCRADFDSTVNDRIDCLGQHYEGRLPLAVMLPVECSFGPMTPGGDTHCEGTVAGCDALVHMYDVEDALNHYKVACGCIAYDNYGRPALRLCDLVAEPAPAVAMAAAAPQPEVPLETHCVADPDGVAYCTTVIADTCSSTTVSNDATASTLACWSTAFGSCSISPFQNPPNLWCEDIQPPDDGAAAASAQAAQPCQSGFGSSWCAVTAGPCRATVYTYTAWGERSANGQCDTDVADCAFAAGGNVVTTTGAGATADCAYGITRCHAEAGVGQVLLPPSPPEAHCTIGTASAAAAEVPPQVCQTGIAQTWCDATVGPCDFRLVPWTAWGDVYLVSDCHFGGGIGPTCHTEVHTQGPLAHEHWCAW